MYNTANQEKREDFWVVLPSNSREATEASGNTLTQFTVKLPRQIKLQGEYEVALVSMQYPHTWYNVPARELFHVVKDPSRKQTAAEGHTHLGDKLVLCIGLSDGGHYNDLDSLCRGLYNMLTKEVRGGVYFQYSHSTRSCKIELQSGYSTYLFEDLAQILGFSEHSIMIKETATAKLPPDLERGRHSLFVYCDIVEPTICGHREVKLLQIAPVSGFYGEVVSKDFSNPHYVRVQPVFHSYKGLVTSGRDIPFREGICILKLHFKPRIRRFAS